MTHELKEQIDDLTGGIEQAKNARLEEKRLRTERNKLAEVVTRLTKELEKAESKRRTMTGMTSSGLSALSQNVNSLKMELEAAEENIALITEAMKLETQRYRDEQAFSDSTRGVIGGLILQERKGEMDELMDKLLALWSLQTFNAGELHNFSEFQTFGRWMADQFYSRYRQTNSEDCRKLFDDALKAAK